jgi:hypothetical protein
MTTLAVIFFVTVSYVAPTVKNNSGSSDTLSSDQSVNDIYLHYMHMKIMTVNMCVPQNSFLKLLLLNCLSCSEVKSGMLYTCKPVL